MTTKKLSPGKLQLTLGKGNNLPSTPHTPDVSPPYRGAEGRKLANTVRRKYFMMVHNQVLQRLAMESSAQLHAYAQEVIYVTVTQMLDRYEDMLGSDVTDPFMKQITERLVEQMANQVLAIVDSHPRIMGEVLW